MRQNKYLILCPKGHGNISITESETVPNAYQLKCKVCGAFAKSNRSPVTWIEKGKPMSVEHKNVDTLQQNKIN